MSEQIQVIAFMAGISIDGMGYGEGDIEGFAKLIVQSCVNQIREDQQFNDRSELQIDIGNSVLVKMGMSEYCKVKP
jgi:hypothetical protein